MFPNSHLPPYLEFSMSKIWISNNEPYYSQFDFPSVPHKSCFPFNVILPISVPSLNNLLTRGKKEDIFSPSAQRAGEAIDLMSLFFLIMHNYGLCLL